MDRRLLFQQRCGQHLANLAPPVNCLGPDENETIIDPMDFTRVIESVTTLFDGAGIRYALIGGFAMAMRGIQRATIDLDLILILEDLELADGILRSTGYSCNYKSENVSHYLADDLDLGRIDILHAFRGPSLSMIERADRIPVTANASLPVVQVEDIIGLKIQAAVNDPKRSSSDWADIRLLVEAAAETHAPLDWILIADYLGLFRLDEKLDTMKDWYGPVDPS
jgi:hypothetical protein